jgi:hypothetical protein
MTTESIRLAVAMRDTAAKVIEPLEDLQSAITLVAIGTCRGTSISSADRTDKAATELGLLLDELAGWWAADHPPDFDPHASSAAEGLLRAAMVTLAHLEATEGASLLAQCRYAELHYPRLDFEMVTATLRCEVVAMSRRPPPDEATQRMIVGESRWWLSSDDISQEAWGAALGGLPSGWSRLGQADKDAVVAGMWTDDRDATATNSLLPLSAADDAILDALDGKCLTADALAEKAKHSRRHIVRRCTGALKDLVRNLPNNGYYRPDRPPPNLLRRGDVTM